MKSLRKKNKDMQAEQEQQHKAVQDEVAKTILKLQFRLTAKTQSGTGPQSVQKLSELAVEVAHAQQALHMQ